MWLPRKRSIGSKGLAMGKFYLSVTSTFMVKQETPMSSPRLAQLNDFALINTQGKF